MHYVKPAILSTLMASKTVMGFAKQNLPEDNPGAEPSQLTAGAAYQADE